MSLHMRFIIQCYLESREFWGQGPKSVIERRLWVLSMSKYFLSFLFGIIMTLVKEKVTYFC
jgi:hypothetical protein